MVACRPPYHTLSASIERHLAPLGIATPARVRLALLVTGLIAAQSAVLAQIARHLFALDLTAARETASIARRLRRTLNDAALTSACHLPAVRAALPPCLTRRPLLVALDESTDTDRVHLLRAAMPYWGNAVPLAWALWEQNVPLPAGDYWQQVDGFWGRSRRWCPRRTACACWRIVPTAWLPPLTVVPRVAGSTWCAFAPGAANAFATRGDAKGDWATIWRVG